MDTNNISISLDPDNSNFVIMSGGYSPNSNYGDDVGILEYFREECIGGADSLIYQIFNPVPEPGIWSDDATIQLCVHGVNDSPLLFLPHDASIENVIGQTIDEDQQLSIDITFNPEQDAEDIYQINSNEITIIDPDILFNSIDLSASITNENFTYEFLDTDNNLNDDVLRIIPPDDINGEFQVTVYATENYDLSLIHISEPTRPY